MIGFPIASSLGIGGGNSAALAGRIRVDGRFFVNDAGTFRPRFASFLSHWMDDGRDAVMDEIAERFNGFRSFAGDLGWAGQTPATARAALPDMLRAAADRNLIVYVCPCTGGGYDVEAHLREVSVICRDFPNTMIDAFNEIGHASQGDIGKDPARALQLARRVIPAGVTWALGAPDGPFKTDEPLPDDSYPTDGGMFNDAHLDRGRDFWNQVRRVREIEKLSAVTRKPAMSGEPIGADERAEAGRRESNPVFFYTLGLLSRGFEVGTVFHSQAGLHGQLLGPVQRACAEAFVAGWRAIDTDERLTFINAGWERSPVAGADFARAIVRAYSFITGNRGWTCIVGQQKDPEDRTGTRYLDPAVRWGGGWSPLGIVADQPGIRVIEITK